MSAIEIKLHTGIHCIETEAKKRLRELTVCLLETEDDTRVAELAAELELLREFIETADFNSLRSSDARLAGIRPGTCTICRDNQGRAEIKSII